MGEYELSVDPTVPTGTLYSFMEAVVVSMIANEIAHISFLVSVPVLSEQIIEVQPRVSTD